MEKKQIVILNSFFIGLVIVILLNYFFGILNFNTLVSLFYGDISVVTGISIIDVVKTTFVLIIETGILSYVFYYLSNKFL